MKVKVRAYQVNYKRYLPVLSIYFDRNGDVSGVTVDNTVDGGINVIPKQSTYLSTSEDFPLSDLILEWFTGLTDRNGKEIYEGDIVEYNNFDFQKQERVNTTHEIIWWNEFSCFTLKDSESDLTFTSDELMVVIGNIHDK